MLDELNKLKFTLTENMTYTIIQINNLYKEKQMIESQLKLYNNTHHYHHLINSKKIIEIKIKKLKELFIKEFHKENKEAIEEYWKIRSKQ